MELTFDCRMVTASPMEGFLLATAEALKARVALLTRLWDWFMRDIIFDNICILLLIIINRLITNS